MQRKHVERTKRNRRGRDDGEGRGGKRRGKVKGWKGKEGRVGEERRDGESGKGPDEKMMRRITESRTNCWEPQRNKEKKKEK